MILRNQATPVTLPRFSSHLSLPAATLLLGASALAATPLAADTGQSSAGVQGKSQTTSSSPDTSPHSTTPMSSGEQDSGSQQAGNQSKRPITERLPDRYQLSNWMDKTVTNSNGEKLGTVKELVMDDVGRLRYVILNSDQLTDSKSDNLVAVPIGHFDYPLAREDHLVLDASPQQMRGAPAFSDRGNMPNMGRPEVSSVIIAYWVPEDAAGGKHGQGSSKTASGHNQQQSAMSGSSYDGNRDIIKLSEQKSELFHELDQNDSGAIERSEAQEHDGLSERFSEADTYGNEAITRSEFAAFELTDKETSSKRDSAEMSNAQHERTSQ